MGRTCLVSLATNDIADRLKPIIEHYKDRESVPIVAVLCSTRHAEIVEQSFVANVNNCDIKLFTSLQALIGFQKKNQDYEFHYLLKHNQRTLMLVCFIYAWVVCRSKKALLFSNLDCASGLIGNSKKIKDLCALLLRATKNLAAYISSYMAGLAFVPVYCLLIFIGMIKKRSDKVSDIRIKNILYIRLDHLGDVICSLPSLYAIKDKYKDAHLTVLASSWAAVILQSNPHLYDELILWDAPWSNKSLSLMRKLIGTLSIVNFLKKLCGSRYDLIIQPRGDFSNVLFAQMINGSILASGVYNNHILYHLMARYISYTNILDNYSRFHIAQWSEDLLQLLGIYVDRSNDCKCVALEDGEAVSEVECIISGAGAMKICTIMIGSGSNVRQWPPEYFVELISQLQSKPIYVVLIGGKLEIETANIIEKLLDVSVYNAVNKLSISAISYLLHRSTYMISLDTSLMHLASLLKVKTVALFGAGNLRFAQPYFNDALILKRELGCSGCADICIFKEGKYAPCMLAVKPTAVFEALSQLNAN